VKLSRLRRPVCFGGLAALLACSTPISPYPLLDDEEEDSPDAGGQLDAGSRPTDAGPAPADAQPNVDAGLFDCDVYSASPSCPRTPPAENTSCSPLPNNGRCFYASRAAGQVQLATCQSAGNSGRNTWRLASARCSYRCSTELPQTGNFFSLLTDDCASRRQRECQDGNARTSQEGADRFLRQVVQGCGLSSMFQLGVTFTQQGCPDWLHYQLGAPLTNTQQNCLRDRLEAVRLGCAASCALTPSTAP
jgi:hypothetical protein